MSIHWLGYAGTTLVVLAYLPQIMHLIREHCSAGLSHKAYATWVVAGLLLLSSAIAVGDTVFIALQGYQLTAAMLICFFCKKYEGQLCEEHDGEMGRPPAEVEGRDHVLLGKHRPGAGFEPALPDGKCFIDSLKYATDLRAVHLRDFAHTSRSEHERPSRPQT